MLALTRKGVAMVNQSPPPTAVELKHIEEAINKDHKRGLETARKIAELLRVKKWLEWMNAERRKQLKKLREKEHPQQFTMYDTITVNTVPSNPTAVAGYVGGRWPTFWSLVKRYRKAKRLSIAISFNENGDCADIENGDMTSEQGAQWAKRQWDKGKRLIVLYFSVSRKGEVEAALNTIFPGWRGRVKFWGAHYTFAPHLEPGFDAIQWTDAALNRNLDASLCSSTFLTP